jgi:signal transduction histidine kinase
MDRKSIRVLLVDDDRGDAELTRRALTEIGNPCFAVESAAGLDEAIKRLSEQDFDVALLDLGLPDSQGTETLKRFRQVSRDDLPIIVLTGLVDEQTALEAVGSGAQDYITKDDIASNLLARSIRYALHRQHLLHQVKTTNELLEEKNRRLAQLYNTAQQFVENVSHEFRTPLTVIREFTSIIRDGIDGPVTAKQKDHLSKVLNRTDDLSLMVDDMLDISRLEAGLLGVWRRPCQTIDLVDNVAGLLKGRAALKRITLSTNVAPELPVLYCDEEKARRVIMNLAVNAIKFAPEGGKVDIWARLSTNGSDVEIGTSDNGPGISSDNVQVIFDRFRQVDQALHSSTKGFGLGLNIAKELVALNLGQINVASSPGTGSTFWFSVPPHDNQILFNHYLTRLVSASSTRPEVSLFSVEAHSSKSDAVPVVDEFLQRSVHANDLVMSCSNDRWVIAADCTEADQRRMAQRLISEWNDFVRNSPQVKIVPLQIEYRGTWSIDTDRDDLSAAFMELCGLKSGGQSPSRTVLVVDDDREVSSCLALRLNSAGFEVVSASDGAEGLEFARSARPDAIVLDVRMPKMDGLTMLKELRTDREIKQTPVVMLSASIRDQQDALQAGANYFVRKPYDAVDVLTAIESSIARPTT